MTHQQFRNQRTSPWDSKPQYPNLTDIFYAIALDEIRSRLVPGRQSVGTRVMSVSDLGSSADTHSPQRVSMQDQPSLGKVSTGKTADTQIPDRKYLGVMGLGEVVE